MYIQLIFPFKHFIRSIKPQKKKSLEEKRVAITPSLLNTSDTGLVMTGLTESSSSGVIPAFL